jgi:tRNA A37 N6-isopentenylltransferase MiaA
VDYKDDIPISDIYRLNKSLKYAIASNGERYKPDIDENLSSLSEIFDFRCFFLIKQKRFLIKDIHKRCDEMVEKGIIDETLNFIREAHKRGLYDFDRQSISLPIGFTESKEIIEKVMNLLERENLRKTHENNKNAELLKEMVSKFQASSRFFLFFPFLFLLIF